MIKAFTKAEREERAYIQILIKWNRQGVVPVWGTQGCFPGFWRDVWRAGGTFTTPRKFRGLCISWLQELFIWEKGAVFLGSAVKAAFLMLRETRSPRKPKSSAMSTFRRRPALMNASKSVAARSHSGVFLFCFSGSTLVKKNKIVCWLRESVMFQFLAFPLSFILVKPLVV